MYNGGAVHVDSEHLPEESHRKLADLIYELIVYEG